MNISETIQSVARQLRDEERATALTEFVIILPIFLVAFGGILSLYDAHETALRTHALASAELWKDVRPIQTSYKAQHMHPVAGAIDAGLHYNNTGQWSFAAAKDIGEALGGMYSDSGAKVSLAAIVEDVGVDEVYMSLDGIVGNNNSHAFNLMNDRILAGQMDMEGFSEIASTLLTKSGARPALAAGIRYGIGSSVVRKDFPSSPWLSGQAEAAYTAAAPPMPEERLMAVALTRLEMGTEEPLQEALMPFTMVPKFASAGSVQSGDELQEQGEECAQEAREWAECRDKWGVFCTKDKPDCGGAAAEQDGKDMLECLKDPPGGDSANCG
ncbi:hypothetical protein FRC98_00440 [Lujinxingia vulgaris]|uniref:Uncharacterized protein n=1 Tax=Lujinxingia vulgaris TaxID=2600176 RepID=A0A5C6XGB6_9DELT|nr:hypothetical protein [Lujinxingia vulgaris]TXD38904.1 hypothetical protein FRC98_00440 [Lujinxingia vulgaris]